MEDIEQWRTAIYDGIIYDNYKVSNWGRILSLNYKRTGKPELITPFQEKNGYLKVILCKNKKTKTCLVHRLEAETFLPNPENKPQVNHKIEGKKGKTLNIVIFNKDGSINKEKSNLEWVTPKENSNHGTRTERSAKTRSKPVLQFTLDGHLIREWSSTMECERNGFHFGNVAACCRGEKPHYKGFKWKYK